MKIVKYNINYCKNKNKDVFFLHEIITLMSKNDTIIRACYIVHNFYTCLILRHFFIYQLKRNFDISQFEDIREKAMYTERDGKLRKNNT